MDKNIKTSKTFGFIELNDGSFFKNIQIVLEENLENFKEISKLPISSSILVEGKLVSTEVLNSHLRLNATKIVVEGNSDNSISTTKEKTYFRIFKNYSSLKTKK